MFFSSELLHVLLALTKDCYLSKNWYCAIYRMEKLVSIQYESILCPVQIDYESVEIELRFFCESIFLHTPRIQVKIQA